MLACLCVVVSGFAPGIDAVPGAALGISVQGVFYVMLSEMLAVLTDMFVFHYYHPPVIYHVVTTKSIGGEELTRKNFSGNLIASCSNYIVHKGCAYGRNKPCKQNKVDFFSSK